MTTRAEPFGKYIRDFYGLDLQKGEHVVCADGKRGVVVACTNYVHVLCDGEKHDVPYHPNDIAHEAPFGAEHDAVTNAKGSGKIGP